jgi:HEPN domain-containing protein
VIKAKWQRLAEERARDAEALLGTKRWSAAYYLSGYAVEYGLKRDRALRSRDES